MAKKSANKWFIGGCIVFVLLGFLACCGGGLALLIGGPQLLIALVLDKEPMDVEVLAWSPAEVEALEDRLAVEMLETRTIQLTGRELTQLVISGEDNDLEVFRIDIDDQQRAVLDLSIDVDDAKPRYLNIHGTGDFTIEYGWFTEMTVDEMDIGSFDLGQYITGQDLTDDANQNLAQQRVQDPNVAETLDMIELLTIEDGKFKLVMTQEGVDKLVADGKLELPEP